MKIGVSMQLTVATRPSIATGRLMHYNYNLPYIIGVWDDHEV